MGGMNPAVISMMRSALTKAKFPPAILSRKLAPAKKVTTAAHTV
jgi:hypothetical protein